MAKSTQRILSAFVLASVVLLAIIVTLPGAQHATAQGVLTPGGRGDITAVTAGSGLTGGATSGAATLNVGAGSGITVTADAVSADTSYLQRLVTGTCGAGLAVQVISSDGSVTCTAASDGDITSVGATSGGGLTGGSTSGAALLGLLTTCSSTQVLAWNGSAWACAANGGISDGDKGDITVSASGATWTIDAAAVTLAKMANIATQTFIGRTTAATGVPEALTATQATAMLNPFTSALKGLAPASGGGTANYLRADGTWATPPDTNTTYTGGTGVLLTGTSFSADLAGASCVAGEYMSALGSTGTGTCTAEVGDISAVTAGNGLTGGGTAGAVTVDVAVGTGLSVAADAINLNLSGASCAAGQAVTAIGSTGTGTCSSVGGDVAQTVSTTGTINDLVLNSTTTTLIFTSASAVTLTGMSGGADGRCVNVVNAGGSVIDVTHEGAGSTAANRVATSGVATWRHHVNEVFTACYDGASSRWRLDSQRQVPSLTVSAAATVGTTLGVTGATTLTGALTANGNTTLGDANTDTLTITSKINSNVHYTGTAPTPSACGTSPTMESGSNDRRGVINVGLSATACTLTFAGTWSAAPVCTLQFEFADANTYLTIKSRSTTAITFEPGSTAAFDKGSGTKVHYHCDGIL